jgi:hypothetical protein
VRLIVWALEGPPYAGLEALAPLLFVKRAEVVVSLICLALVEVLIPVEVAAVHRDVVWPGF